MKNNIVRMCVSICVWISCVEAAAASSFAATAFFASSALYLKSFIVVWFQRWKIRISSVLELGCRFSLSLLMSMLFVLEIFNFSIICRSLAVRNGAQHQY